MNGGQIDAVANKIKQLEDRVKVLEEALKSVRVFVNDWGPDETEYVRGMTNDHLALIDRALEYKDG